jgi:hypothetical protein
MNFWLKSLHRYSVPQVNTYPTVTNAVTIITTLSYGWTSDALQLRSPNVYFSLGLLFRGYELSHLGRRTIRAEMSIVLPHGICSGFWTHLPDNGQ